MGIIDYWTEYIDSCKKYIKSDKFIVNLTVKDLIGHSKISKYFFFKNRVELIRFIKYVVLPTFVFNRININKDIQRVEVKDYKDVLNYFMKNEIINSKELIKRYSYFYNSLEEFEYENNKEYEEELIRLIKNIDNYFSKDEIINSNLKIYLGIENFLESILANDNIYFNEKLIKDFGVKDKEELKEFFSNNKNNDIIMNFLIEIVSQMQDEDKNNIIIKI